jgi:putative endonuclease
MNWTSLENSWRTLIRNWLRTPSPGDRADSEDPRAETGRAGERAAAAALKRNGYKILYRNFRASKGGEVDLVCRDRAANVLVFVEVKTRMFDDPDVRPSDAVNRDKQNLIARGALEWLRLLGNPEIAARFDVVEVILSGDHPRVEIIRDAFALPSQYIY